MHRLCVDVCVEEHPRIPSHLHKQDRHHARIAMASTPAVAAAGGGGAAKRPRKSSSEGMPPRLPTHTPLAAFLGSAAASSVGVRGTGGSGGRLVPIRVDVDVGGHRLVDALLLDPDDSTLGPEQASRGVMQQSSLHSSRSSGLRTHDTACSLTPPNTSTTENPVGGTPRRGPGAAGGRPRAPGNRGAGGGEHSGPARGV